MRAPPRGSLGAAVALAAWCVAQQCALVATEPDLPRDSLDDDHTEAIKRLRERINVKERDVLRNGTYGVVMVAGPAHMPYSQMTIPIWREFAREHGYGFFLQEEALNTDFGFEWTKPRVLMELLGKVKWRYMMVVDPDTLPVGFNRTMDFMIKMYFRKKRYANDDTSNRYIFCPENCQSEAYKSAYTDGACAGPFLTGCIFWSKKPQARKLVRSWYVKRFHDEVVGQDNMLMKAFMKMRDRNYEKVIYQDIQSEVGKANSTFIATLSAWDEEFEKDTTRRIHTFIKKHDLLSKVGNLADKREEEEALEMKRQLPTEHLAPPRASEL